MPSFSPSRLKKQNFCFYGLQKNLCTNFCVKLNPNKKNSNYQLYRYWAYVPFLRHIQYLPRLVCTCSGANVRVSGKNKMWWEFMPNAYRYQHFANYLLCSNFLPLFECFYIPFHIVGHNFVNPLATFFNGLTSVYFSVN